MIEKLVTYIERHHFNKYWILFIDIVVSVFSTLAINLIFKSFVGKTLSLYTYFKLALISFCASVIAILVLKTHEGVLRHTTMKELLKVSGTSLFKGINILIITFIFSALTEENLNLQNILLIILLDVALTLLLLILIRIVAANLYDVIIIKRAMSGKKRENVLIYGDLDDSVATFDLIKQAYHKYYCVGFVKVDHNGNSKTLCGLNVYIIDDENSFAKLVLSNNVCAVVFPNNLLLKQEQNRLVIYANNVHIRIMLKPSLSNIYDGVFATNMVRNVKIEDLLSREENKIDEVSVREFLTDKVVMVTGGAGSIGSELCRMLVSMPIKRLILIDTAETSMHDMLLELSCKASQVSKTFQIADIRNFERMKYLFDKYEPNIVFHAAAYKHVPMMEMNPFEAISVNVLGTRNVVKCSIEHNVEKFIMVSTDKAVNPTSVMGASKRIAEIGIQTVGNAINNGRIKGKTKFITTRFGNVLGSNGSVIPLFRNQIVKGGPITITDPRIERYFMTIPEACGLVLEAAEYGNGGDIFIFDMGNPVKIVDLAKNMISLSGLELDRDIEIKYVGLRAGEKLYEELWNDGENIIPTKYEKIFKAKVKEYDFDDIMAKLKKLQTVVNTMKNDDIVTMMKVIVPEFASTNSRYSKLDKK